MQDRTWKLVGRLRQWLDDEAAGAAPADVRLLRVLKIGEELGEVAEALHGALGTNPRKGHSHDWDDVQTELVDVIVTSMVALATITPDANQVFRDRLDTLVERVLSAPQRDPGTAAKGLAARELVNQLEARFTDSPETGDLPVMAMEEGHLGVVEEVCVSTLHGGMVLLGTRNYDQPESP
ncbi:MazG-like family protein [Streptomyces sp. NPDC018057]|uniref:MazG-like family protein n=1 Tax=unclassified Streptomyces TaxID=2593676 RepID=UPI0037B1CF22